MMQSREKIIARYCRAAERGLSLPRRQRKALLAGLREELEVSEWDGGSMDSLTGTVGMPSAAARELMESVPPDAALRFHRRRKWLLTAAVVLLAAVTVGTIFYAKYSIDNSIGYIEDHVVTYYHEIKK